MSTLIENANTAASMIDSWRNQTEGTIVQIKIPEGIKAIRRYAYAYYYYNSSLEIEPFTLAIPEGVTEIGLYAFYSNYKIENYYLPSTLTSIGYNAFSSDTKTPLRKIFIPVSVVSIGDYAFRNTNLMDVYYEGSEVQWSAVTKGVNIFPEWYHASVAMHYNSKREDAYPST